ncbi:MAG: hypothetical protein GC184_02195 [Rhizobiales bacterium]|nr:hypothetical protein [Hyphomicrobiales bacterium]
MENKARRDRFWIFLSVILITIFVIQRERPDSSSAHASSMEEHHASYDRDSMDDLMRQVQAVPTASRSAYNPNDDLITGSIRSSGLTATPRPLARPSVYSANQPVYGASPAPAKAAPAHAYYVSLGAYSNIEAATSRYLSVLNRRPDLQGQERVSIETITDSEGRRLHNVRMGAFDSDGSARAACARAALAPAECAVIAL